MSRKRQRLEAAIAAMREEVKVVAPVVEQPAPVEEPAPPVKAPKRGRPKKKSIA